MGEELKKTLDELVKDGEKLTEEQQHDLLMIAKGMAIEAKLREKK